MARSELLENLIFDSYFSNAQKLLWQLWFQLSWCYYDFYSLSSASSKSKSRCCFLRFPLGANPTAPRLPFFLFLEREGGVGRSGSSSEGSGLAFVFAAIASMSCPLALSTLACKLTVGFSPVRVSIAAYQINPFFCKDHKKYLCMKMTYLTSSFYSCLLKCSSKLARGRFLSNLCSILESCFGNWS